MSPARGGAPKKRKPQSNAARKAQAARQARETQPTRKAQPRKAEPRKAAASGKAQGVRRASQGQPRQARQLRPAAAGAQHQAGVVRQGLGGDQIEGRQAVRELLRARRRRVRELWVAEGVEDYAIVGEILDLAAEDRIPVRRVARAQLEAAAGTEAPQGVLARTEPLPEADLEALARPRRAPDGSRTPPFLLALDGVTDPHNLGAMLRSADLAGATGLIVPRHRSAHITPAAAKAAAGAIEHVPIALVPGLPAALARLSALGVWVVGLDADADQPVWDLELATEPIVLVFGSEGKGLSDLTKKRCDALVTIPQLGNLGSLNVSAAGAVACFEVARRRFFAPIANGTSTP
jgi:23S rRNA (guanosine2251-2'-O)-methyltransferase